MTPVSRDKRNTNIERLAIEAFAGHELIKAEPGRYFIRNPKHGMHAAEICLLRYSTILVHGDVDGILLRGGHGIGTDDVSRLKWAAQSDLDYLQAKISDMAREEWDDEVALGELIARVEEAREESSSVFDALDDVLQDFRGGFIGGPHQLHEALYEATAGDSELRCGYVPPSSLIYCREAIRRLLVLLEAKEKAA